MSITDYFVDGLAGKKLKHAGVNQTPRLIAIHYSVTNAVAPALKNGDVVHVRSVRPWAAGPVRPAVPAVAEALCCPPGAVDIGGSDAHAGFVSMTGPASPAGPRARKIPLIVRRGRWPR